MFHQKLSVNFWGFMAKKYQTACSSFVHIPMSTLDTVERCRVGVMTKSSGNIVSFCESQFFTAFTSDCQTIGPVFIQTHTHTHTYRHTHSHTNTKVNTHAPLPLCSLLFHVLHRNAYLIYLSPHYLALCLYSQIPNGYIQKPSKLSQAKKPTCPVNGMFS